MKVFRLDFDYGEYYTLTEEELHKEFTNDQIISFNQDDNTIFYETKFTDTQLKHARNLHEDEDYCIAFEEQYGIAPEVYDILKELY